MEIWKTYRIADIITQISDEKFVLPCLVLIAIGQKSIRAFFKSK